MVDLLSRHARCPRDGRKEVIIGWRHCHSVGGSLSVTRRGLTALLQDSMLRRRFQSPPTTPVELGGPFEPSALAFDT